MRSFLIACVAAFSAPAAAEVVTAGANGFEVRHMVQVPLPPATAYQQLGRIGSWWGDDHTYSGKAANMRLALEAGGCFCEAIPATGGGVEHMRVAVAQPGLRILMTGSLGPLLYEATAGSMEMKIDAVRGGSKVVMTYRAAGFARGNGEKMAPLVDSVLGEQMKRFAAFAAK